MARILCAWEFGGDLGHIRTLVPIARALRDAGHEVFFAFRDATRLEMAAREGFEVYPAPLMRLPAEVDPHPRNFADILLNLGFANPAAVAGAVKGWRSLFKLLRIEAVVADYAPTCLVAARAQGLNRVGVGNGFSTPPRRDPLPNLRPALAMTDDELRAFDARLAVSIGHALGQNVTLAEVLEADTQLLTTFAELDPYGPRALEYVGPVDIAQDGALVSWADRGTAPRVCAYLQPRDARFAPVLQALRESEFEAIVVAPGLSEAEARAAASRRCRVVTEFVQLAPLLAEADLCVFHGGSGTACLALASGVPMVALPMHLEQSMIAARVEAAGCAVVALPDAEPASLAALITAAVGDEAMRARTRDHARNLPAATPGDAAARVAHRVAALVGA